jgi:hypothetical protein
MLRACDRESLGVDRHRAGAGGQDGPIGPSDVPRDPGKAEGPYVSSLWRAVVDDRDPKAGEDRRCVAMP